MKLIIAGSRSWPITFYDIDKAFIQYNLNPDVIISGGASNGADKTAIEYATTHNIPLKIILPSWSNYGRSAGMRRNIAMSIEGDAVLAFWDEISNGTKHMMDIMNRIGKPVYAVTKKL